MVENARVDGRLAAGVDPILARRPLQDLLLATSSPLASAARAAGALGLARALAPLAAALLVGCGALTGAALGRESDRPDAVPVQLTPRALAGYAAPPTTLRAGPLDLRSIGFDFSEGRLVLDLPPLPRPAALRVAREGGAPDNKPVFDPRGVRMAFELPAAGIADAPTLLARSTGRAPIADLVTAPLASQSLLIPPRPADVVALASGQLAKLPTPGPAVESRRPDDVAPIGATPAATAPGPSGPPAAASAAPSAPTQAPATSPTAVAPSAPATAPSAPTTAPSAPTTAPSTPTAAPSAPTAAPSAPAAAPSAPAPAATATSPASPTAAPPAASPTPAPASPTSLPATPQETAAPTRESAPRTGAETTASPVADSPVPASATPKPNRSADGAKTPTATTTRQPSSSSGPTAVPVKSPTATPARSNGKDDGAGSTSDPGRDRPDRNGKSKGDRSNDVKSKGDRSNDVKSKGDKNQR